MKKNFFSENRLTYAELPNEYKGGLTSKIDNIIAGPESGIEAAIASKNTPAQASMAAHNLIGDSCAKIADKIANAPQTPKEEKANWIKEVYAIRDAAWQKIKANMGKYENLAKFIAKKAELSDLIPKNYDALKALEGKTDTGSLKIINMTIAGLNAALLQIERENLALEGQWVGQQIVLSNQVRDQITALTDAKKPIMDFHSAELDKAGELLAQAYKNLRVVKAEDEGPGKDKNGNPIKLKYADGREVSQVNIAEGTSREFSEAAARVAWQSLTYLKGMDMDLAGVDEEVLLNKFEKAKTVAAKVEPLLQWFDGKHMRFGEDNDARRKQWERLAGLEEAVANAPNELERGKAREKYEEGIKAVQKTVLSAQAQNMELASDMPMREPVRMGRRDEAQEDKMFEDVAAKSKVWEKIAEKRAPKVAPAKATPVEEEEQPTVVPPQMPVANRVEKKPGEQA